MKNFPPLIKPFQEITNEYEFVFRNSDQKAIYYNRLISKGFRIPSAGKYYQYNSINEANEIRTKLKLEIDRKYTLELTASFEAKLVYYFRNIIKRNNPMYKGIKSSAKRGSSFLMFQHFIPVFKEQIYPKDNFVYANFINLIDFRNWLAHGRSWDLNSSIIRKFDFEYTYETICAIIDLLPDYPNELKL